MRLSDAEFWDLTWREFDALGEQLRSSVRRDDARAARICQMVVLAFTGENVALESFMPAEATQSQPAMDMTDKIHNVMQQLGGERMDLKPAPERTADEFREHMWKLMDAK